MIILGVPCIDKHELTKDFVGSIVNTLANPVDFELVIIDNGSEVPYTVAEFGSTPFPLSIQRYEENKGFYYPLKDLYEHYGGTHYIGLCHNDIYFYEREWDNRMRFAFRTYPDLALIGLCGSNQIDFWGGRGMGTVMNFRGQRGAKAGVSFTELAPAVVLDSLFMLFRATEIPLLKIDDNITPCHFYDRIWSMRILENQKRLGVMGIEIDHMGGTTSCDTKYQEFAKLWCKTHGIPLENNSGDLALYHEGERRLLTEYREQKKIIPCRIDTAYKLWKF